MENHQRQEMSWLCVWQWEGARPNIQQHKKCGRGWVNRFGSRLCIMFRKCSSDTISQLVGTLSPVNHKGLYQGWGRKLKGPVRQKQDQKDRVRKRRVVERIYGMKYSWKGHRDRNSHKYRTKMSGQARLVYVKKQTTATTKNMNHNIPTTWRWTYGDHYLKPLTIFKRQRCEMLHTPHLLKLLNFLAWI